MNKLNVELLISWLGQDGAIAGLIASNITNIDLYEIVIMRGGKADKKMRRTELVNEIINFKTKRIEKSIDELKLMKREEIKSIFEKNNVSWTEIFEILDVLGIEISSSEKTKIYDVAAREISDLGMYSRIANKNR